MSFSSLPNQRLTWTKSFNLNPEDNKEKILMNHLGLLYILISQVHLANPAKKA